MLSAAWLMLSTLFYSLQLSTGSFPKPLMPQEERHYLELSAQEDLISIGTIGLIKGISTFDPQKSSRLATYAARCVENVTLSPATLTHGGRWRVVESGLSGGFWSGFRRICTSFPGRRILG